MASPLVATGDVPEVQVANVPNITDLPQINTLLNLAPTTLTNTAFTSAALVNTDRFIAVDINVTAAAGTTPSITFAVDRLGADGVWYNLWTSSAVTAVGTVSIDIGSGMTIPKTPVGAIRVRASIPTGTTPSFTFTISVIGVS